MAPWTRYKTGYNTDRDTIRAVLYVALCCTVVRSDTMGGTGLARRPRAVGKDPLKIFP